MFLSMSCHHLAETPFWCSYLITWHPSLSHWFHGEPWDSTHRCMFLAFLASMSPHESISLWPFHFKACNSPQCAITLLCLIFLCFLCFKPRQLSMLVGPFCTTKIRCHFLIKLFYGTSTFLVNKELDYFTSIKNQWVHEIMNRNNMI